MTAPARIAVVAVMAATVVAGLAGCTSGTPHSTASATATATTAAPATALSLPRPAPGELGRIVYESRASQQELDVHGAVSPSGYQVEAGCLDERHDATVEWTLSDAHGRIAASSIRCDGAEQIATAIAAGTDVAAAHLTLTGDTSRLRRAYVILTPAP